MYTPPLPRKNFPQSKKKSVVDSDGPPLRVYQAWKGRNKFFFGGRVIFGPDVQSIFLTLSLILVPVILFWTRVAEDLIFAYPHGWGILVIVFSGLLTLHVVVLLFLTSGRDPGIIPRNAYPPEPDDCDSSILSLDWTGNHISQVVIPPTKNVTINGMVIKVKYCQTCKLYRPPRCSHCSICNNCVERFDHHCPWVGQCIGKRNYRHFFMFVSSTFLLCLYVLVCCLINITRIMNEYDCAFWRAVEKSPVSGALILYTFVVSWFVGGLTTFHLYLISTNQTTYENFRYQYDLNMNPYNLGFSSNCMEVFCSKIPSSKNDFRARIEVDSSPDFSTLSYSNRAMKPQMPTRTFDLEMGNRRTLDDDGNADDYEEDTRSQVGGLGKLERCSTEPRRNIWEPRMNLGILSPETPEFGIGPYIQDREKSNVDTDHSL